jgi:hypothetical protein
MHANTFVGSTLVEQILCALHDNLRVIFTRKNGSTLVEHMFQLRTETIVSQTKSVRLKSHLQIYIRVHLRFLFNHFKPGTSCISYSPEFFKFHIYKSFKGKRE